VTLDGFVELIFPDWLDYDFYFLVPDFQFLLRFPYF